MEKKIWREIVFEGISLRDELEHFLEHLEEEGKSPLTIKNYRGWIIDYLYFLENHSEKKTIQRNGDILEVIRLRLSGMNYRDYLEKKKQKPSTINSKLIALNSFFTFAEFTEISKKGKAVQVKFKLLERAAKHSVEDEKLLEMGDYFRLLKTAEKENDYRATALFKFLFNTGARISEALSVNIEDIQAVGQSYKVTISGKRSKKRDIDFNGDTYQALKRYLEDSERSFKDRGPLFITHQKIDGEHNRITPRYADHILKKFAELSGVPKSKCFCHNFRHLIAKTLLDQGTSIDKVKNFLGHTDISTTAIYTMGKASELREIKTSAIMKAQKSFIAEELSDEELMIFEALRNNRDLMDQDLAEMLGISKATFSRRYREKVEELRGLVF